MINNATYKERELLQQLAKGNETAFRVIFMRYGPKLKNYVLKLSRSIEAAEDIVHDVFLNIWKNREKLSEINHFDSYLYAAARHNAHRSFQRHARETLILVELKYTAGNEIAFGGEEQINMSEVQLFIRQAVDKLTPQQRKIFLLSRDQGYNHEEIAAKLGISRRTVANTITIVLRILREDIKLQYGSFALAIIVLYLFI